MLYVEMSIATDAEMSNSKHFIIVSGSRFRAHCLVVKTL